MDQSVFKMGEIVQNFIKNHIRFSQQMVVFLLLFFFSSCARTSAPISTDSHPYRLAICAMFKNEAPWLKEWILYHHKVLGVDHFYLYNNDSTDQYKEVLQPFIDQQIVDLIDWSSDAPAHKTQGAFNDAPWVTTQIGAYNDCLKNKALGRARWVAMIDIDEFIVPTKGVAIFYKLLDHAQKKNKGSVCLHWRVFGTSHVEELTHSDLLTEKLTWRSRDDHPWNQRVKSIYRPEGVSFCLVHVAEKLNPNFGSTTLNPNEVRIHHYWSRTKKFCLERRKLSELTDPGFFEAFHQVEDRSIFQYLPIIKESLNSADE